MINKSKQYLNIGVSGKLELMNYYNKFCYPFIKPSRKYKIKPNDDWCAMFTSVIAHKCGLRGGDFPFEVSVFQQCEIAKANGNYFTDVKKAQPNDLIIYDWKKGNRYNHVGFVVSVDGDILKAIEGNKNNTVAYRRINKNSKLIRGFIRTGTVTPDKGDIKLLAIDTLLGKFGDGEQRKNALGDAYNDVQNLINSR